MVVSRVGGEGGAYYPGEEGLAEGVHTVNGNILSLSDEEMAMIEEAKANFDKVIVLVNAANPMEIANLQAQRNILIFPLENSLSLSIWLRLMPITVVTLFPVRMQPDRLWQWNSTIIA